MTSPQPLAGLQVLEFSHTIMGPCAGMLLADLGADVIKIEPTPNGDHTRRLPGFASGFYSTFCRNKRSLVINLKSSQGQAVVHQLVKSADLVLENYGPGTMERLNCGWEQLHQVNPKLIYLALKGFLAGPYEHRPALDEVVQFQSGLAFMTGPAGRPLRAGASIVDILAAVFGVSAALAALRERDTSQQGQKVSSALFESAAFLMASHMAGHAATGVEPIPMPERRGAWGIYDLFDTADGKQIFIGITSDAQWIRFCQVFALTDLGQQNQLLGNTERVNARSWLIPRLAETFAAIDYEKIASMSEQANISWAPVGHPQDLAEDIHLMAQGLLPTNIYCAGTPAQAQTKLPASPVAFGEPQTRPSMRMQPPLVGEHSIEVLQQAGYDRDQIDALLADQIIVTPDQAPQP